MSRGVAEIAHDSNSRLGILLLQMGGPTSLGEVEPFLRRLLSDPALVRLPFFLRPFQGRLAARWARKRAPRTREWYRAIGGGSPLVATTDELAGKLEAHLRSRGREGALVRVAYSYNEPLAGTALDELEAAGARRLVVVSLYPHYSLTTSGPSLAAVRLALRDRAIWREAPHRIEAWPLHPGYLDLLAGQVEKALSRLKAEASDDDYLKQIVLICSAHGLPQRYLTGGDPYLEQINSTFEALKERLAPLKCRLGFQSRIGPFKWLEPETSALVEELAGSHRHLMVLPLGFVCDHLETLYELDVQLKPQALQAGFETFQRIPTFNADDSFVALLGRLIDEKLAEVGPTA